MNVVVGGGWAGIAAAVELARAGQPVTLIEAADRLGGRARRVSYRGHHVDNGQHLVIGAYRELLALLDIIGVSESAIFERHPLELRLKALGEPEIVLRLPRLPAPLHLLTGLLGASGLGAVDRARALRFCARIGAPWRGPDRCVGDLLAAAGQSGLLVRRLWEPLCLATLNVPVAVASAEVFTRVLRDAFSRRRADSDFLIARADLDDVFPGPARAYIEGHGGRVLTGRRVVALEDAGEEIAGVRLDEGLSIAAARVILAVPPSSAARLVRRIDVLRPLAGVLDALGGAPICTVYLRYPQSVAPASPLIGLAGSTAQWVCDLAPMGLAGWVSVVISGEGGHMNQSRDRLVSRVTDELAAFFPDWPRPLEGFVLRERRATFRCIAGVNARRPGCETAIRNLFLAGDAVATGYPATLEGAVRAGRRAARLAMGDAG